MSAAWLATLIFSRALWFASLDCALQDMTTKTLILAHALVGLIGLTLTSQTADAAAHTSTTAQVNGGLDKATVREVVRARIDDVRHCYNAELNDNEELAGSVVVDFTIAATGSVHDVKVAESTMPARFDTCMAKRVATWQFPAAAQPTAVSYPFVMEPG